MLTITETIYFKFNTNPFTKDFPLLMNFNEDALQKCNEVLEEKTVADNLMNTEKGIQFVVPCSIFPIIFGEVILRGGLPP